MKTKEADFVFFKKQCAYWIERLGLHGWEVYYDHLFIKGEEPTITAWNVEGRTATLTLNTKLPAHSTVENAARHCVLHLFMARVHDLASSRFATSDEIDEAVHDVIRTLENLLLL